MFSRICKTFENNKNRSASGLVIFIILSCFTNTWEQWKSLGSRPRDFRCSVVFGNPGKTLALVYEILRHKPFLYFNALMYILGALLLTSDLSRNEHQLQFLEMKCWTLMHNLRQRGTSLLRNHSDVITRCLTRIFISEYLIDNDWGTQHYWI